MKLSVVSTLYKSAPYVAEFHRRISAEAARITADYEIIFVNDGSPDDAVERARALHDPHVAIVDLSRNFGHHRAMMCGLQHATGERVFLIDVDLEEAPENLGRFWAAMEAAPEADVIVGETPAKQGSWLKKLSSSWFYVLFHLLSPVTISDREIVSRLMKRPYVDALIAYRERELFFPGIWVHAGFHQQRIAAEKTFDGHSSYTLRRKITMAVEAITSFSVTPLVLIFYMGCLFSVGSALVIVYLCINKFVYGNVFQGWTSLVAILFFIGGLILFSLGVVGIYVAKLYTEVKQRPATIVKQIYRSHP